MKHQVSVFVEEAAEQLQVCCFSDLRSLSGRNCFSLPKHRQFMDSHWQRVASGTFLFEALKSQKATHCQPQTPNVQSRTCTRGSAAAVTEVRAT